MESLVRELRRTYTLSPILSRANPSGGDPSRANGSCRRPSHRLGELSFVDGKFHGVLWRKFCVTCRPAHGAPGRPSPTCTFALRTPSETQASFRLPQAASLAGSQLRPAGGGGLVPVRPEEKFATDIFILDGMKREFSEDGQGRPPTGPAEPVYHPTRGPVGVLSTSYLQPLMLFAGLCYT